MQVRARQGFPSAAVMHRLRGVVFGVAFRHRRGLGHDRSPSSSGPLHPPYEAPPPHPADSSTSSSFSAPWIRHLPAATAIPTTAPAVEAATTTVEAEAAVAGPDPVDRSDVEGVGHVQATAAVEVSEGGGIG